MEHWSSTRTRRSNNHFGGPIVDEHQPDKHLEDHVRGDNVDEEVDEVSQANEEVHVVGDDESSTDENFDMAEHDDQHDKSEEDSVYESAKEDNASVNDPAKDPVEYRRRALMVRQLDSNLDENMWELTGTHMVLAMMVVEQAGVRMIKKYFEIEASKATPQ